MSTGCERPIHPLPAPFPLDPLPLQRFLPRPLDTIFGPLRSRSAYVHTTKTVQNPMKTMGQQIGKKCRWGRLKRSSKRLYNCFRTCCNSQSDRWWWWVILYRAHHKYPQTLCRSAKQVGLQRSSVVVVLGTGSNPVRANRIVLPTIAENGDCYTIVR